MMVKSKSELDIGGRETSFLAPTGAQEVTLCVCVSVYPSVIFVNSSLNLHAIFMHSLSSQLAVS